MGLRSLFKKPKQLKIEMFVKEGFELLDKPDKSINFLPSWFKNIKPFSDKKDLSTATVKKCVPFLDAMSLGYIIPMWADLKVVVEPQVELYDSNSNLISSGIGGLVNDKACLSNIFNESINNYTDLIGYNFNGKEIADVSLGKLGINCSFNGAFSHDDTDKKNLMGVVSGHSASQVGGGFPQYPLGDQVVKLHSPWSIRCPKGYSLYYKNPPNHFENKICFFEALVDVDEYLIPPNFPFIWTGSERGTFYIKRGTPLVHIIPIKREIFTECHKVLEEKELANNQNLLTSSFTDGYRNNFWHNRKSK